MEKVKKCKILYRVFLVLGILATTVYLYVSIMPQLLATISGPVDPNPSSPAIFFILMIILIASFFYFRSKYKKAISQPLNS